MPTVYSPQPTSTLNIIFMGTPAFAVPSLQALHEAGHSIAAVYTQPPRPAGRGQKDTPSPVHLYASRHHLPVYTPISLKTPEAQAQFASHGADAAIVAAYGLLLPKPILDACPMGCINVHPSLLPRWRGAAPIQRTIMAGDTDTGICIMQMDEGLDTGPVLAVEHYPIPAGTTAGALHDTLAAKAGPLLLRALSGLHAKTIAPQPQAEDGIVYAKKILKEDTRIEWGKSAEHIYHQILGLSPSPGAYFYHNGEAVKIFDAYHDAIAISEPPGTVVDSLAVVCNPGILHPLTLQRPGRKRISKEEFLRGLVIPAGTRFS